MPQDVTTTSKPRVHLILDLGIAALLSTALLVASHGGFAFALGPLRVSAHGLARPLLVCVVLIGVRVSISGKAQPHAVAAMVGRIGFLALAGAVVGIWFMFLVTSCGGADSYGYVSASRLVRSLRLSQSEPLARELPVAEPLAVVAPLGYVPGRDGETIVPVYPLGLPFVMAFAGSVFGDGAEFYVSPLLAVLGVAAAYGIARGFTDAAGAALSALLVAVTPAFAHQAIQPMSDVAATCWMLVAVWCLVRTANAEPGQAVAAGIAAGMAFLTRPALVTAVVALIGVTVVFRGRRSAAFFVAAFAPFLVFQTWLQWHLYGSVFSSGYGTASHLFTPARVPTNVMNYFKWVNYSLSPLFVAIFAVGAFARGTRAWWIAAVALAVAVAAPHLLYFTYDDWEVTRFLLPGIAVAVIVCGVTIGNVVNRWTHSAVAPLVILAIACAAAAVSHRFLDRHHTFALAHVERRYPRVADWIDRTTPLETVVFAFQHSGSIRFYSQRPTLRWDQMTGDELAASVASLKARGWRTLAVLEGPDEATAFWPRVERRKDALLVEPAERVQGVDILALHTR
jgi:hypothetical protein